ncbi:hypothetical protein [Streptomyces sp. NPDC003077]|uniref:hypothetical protein n=1 Tax=Streptomyces sp. NPDC003077 TaxID=3154443 RepID=UPI0033AE0581
MRNAAPIAGAAVAAALLLSGCGGTGDGAGTGKVASGSPEASRSGDGEGKDADQAFQGAWEAGTDGTKVILVVAERTASLSVGRKTACLGTVEGRTVTVRCSNGDTTRTTGTLEPGNDSKSLTVAWKDGPTDAFTRSPAGGIKLPSGAPTSLPSEVPTTLPSSIPTGLPSEILPKLPAGN